MIALSRRRFLIGSASLVAAPSIVRASEIMPVKAIEPLVQNTPWGPIFYNGMEIRRDPFPGEQLIYFVSTPR